MNKYKSTLSILLLFTALMLASCSSHSDAQVPEIIQSDNNEIISIGDTVTELDKAIFIIFQDKNENYWFGSNGQGVFKYDGKSIVHFSTKDGLCNDQIREIQEDKSGNIYFTTLDGISKFDGQEFYTLPTSIGKEWKLYPEDLWFKGEPKKNGPYRYDGDSLYNLEFPKHYLEDEFYSEIPNPPFSPYEVYSIYKDIEGNVWFGTSNFGICRYNGKSLSWFYEEHLTTIERTGGSFGIRSILEDKDENFWFCNTQYRYKINPQEKDKGSIEYTKEKGIESLKAPNGDPFVYFMSSVEDNNGDLWMATYDSGVWRYDGKNVVHYPIGITSYSIYKDHQGNLWLGTHEAGAYKFNGKTFEKFIP